MNLLLSIFIFILGSSLGSFLSVVIFRLHKNQKGIFFGRSECQHCKKKLTARDLIPILSYALSRGKCRHCKKKLSPYYLFLELSAGLVFLLISFKFPFLIEKTNITPYVINLEMLFKCVMYWIYGTFFIGIFSYDLQYMEIPDLFLFPLIALALGGSLLMKMDILSLIIALGIALIFFGGQILLSRGRWLGEGDLYLAISMAFLFGWKLLLIAIALTYVIGAFLSILLLASKKAGRKSQIPFAPFMVIGSFATIFMGNEILNWYLQTLSF